MRPLAMPPVKPQELLASKKLDFPYLTAAGVYLIELSTDSLLYAKNSDRHFYPASTTKIATALVALNSYQDSSVIEVPPHPVVGQVLGLQTGEQYLFKDLLYGLLVQSGNDAAEVLARAYPEGENSFIGQMNNLVFSLGLKDTHFVNPSGIDSWQHYASPHDLAVLAAHAMQNKEFAQTVGTKGYQISDLSGQHLIHLENVNELLGVYQGMAGVKTGWTELAGECLVSLVNYGEKQYLAVVLASSDRFGDTTRIMDWAKANFYSYSL